MRIEPPFFLMSSSVIHNLNPDPPMPFVEKKGSKICFKVFAFIPEPLSATLILAAFLAGWMQADIPAGQNQAAAAAHRVEGVRNEIEQYLAKFSLEEEECGCGTVADDKCCLRCEGVALGKSIRGFECSGLRRNG
jgi:hypothetical protein